MPKKNNLIVYMFEFACLFHSVFIGIAIGVTTDQQQVLGLMIAVVFHQALEGLSLGCVIAESNLGHCKTVCMIGAYSLITSIGIGIGMAVVDVYAEDSNTKLLVGGIFQVRMCVCVCKVCVCM
jgi:zinc transporter 1/2/3